MDNENVVSWPLFLNATLEKNPQPVVVKRWLGDEHPV